MTDEELVKRLRGRTTKKLSIDWQVGRDCPECGSMADRPKCLWDYGPSCPRHDPDAYDPPAWDHVADKDCAEAADRIEALAEARDTMGHLWAKEAAEKQVALGRIEALTAERDEHWKSFVHWRKEADALTEQLEAARADAKEAEAYAEELEAKVENLTKHHANMADPRYWEGRYRDEKAKLAKAVEALRLIEADCEADYPPSHLAIKYAARATLAEIEGEKK